MESAAQVKSIVPNNTGKSFGENYHKICEDIKNSITAIKAKNQANKESKQAKKEDEKFKTIRAKLVLEAFGITPEKYDQFLIDYANAIKKANEINESPSNAAKNIVSSLEDKKKVAIAASQTDKANKRSIKQNWVSFASSIASSAGLTAAVTALAGTINPAIPIIGLLIPKLISTIMQTRRTRKRQGNDHSDTVEKNRAYDEELKEVVPKIEKFCESINNQKAYLLQEYNSIYSDKSLNKKQKAEKYKNFVKDFVNKTLKENGIEIAAETINAEEIVSKQEPDSPKDTKNNSDKNANKNNENKKNKDTETEQLGM